MRLRSLFYKTLSDRAGLLKSWAAAGGFLSISLTVLYAAVSTLPALPAWLSPVADYLRALPGALPEVPAEWLVEAAWFVALPIFLALFSIELGSRLLAGREQDGQLELLLAYPFSRRRLLLEYYAVLVVATTGMTVLVWAFAGLGFLAAGAIFPHLGTVLEMALMALVFGSLAIAISSRTGRCAPARGISLAGLALAVALELAGQAIPPPLAFLQYLSPLADFAGSHLLTGFRPDFGILLVGLAVALLGLAVIGFDRREVN